jgi:hypothetical protein
MSNANYSLVPSATGKKYRSVGLEHEKITQLRALALKFRAGIEQCDRRSLPVTFEDFPRGACGDASLLLGKYLHAEGFGIFQYVCGIRRRSHQKHEHAWLRQGEVIIDITANQFPEIDQPIIVTTDHTWHSAFEVRNEREADYEVYDDRTRCMFDNAYQKIIERTALL